MINIIKAVIFDLDGTLLNTLEDLTASVNFALRSFSFPERTKEEVKSFIGNGVIKLMERSVPKGIDEVTFEKCFQCFRGHYLEHMYDSTRPYENILPLLQKLKDERIYSAVVSNKLHSGVVGLCEDFFPNLLSCSLGVETENQRKPSPENVFRALKILGVSSEEAIYVGDSEVDVETAKNSKLFCVGVSWGFRSREQLKLCGADVVIDTPFELLEVLKNANS
ncbi:MAG: HAD family hydrolase [Clostridia bacterium]|nr:HAD family hydrolase [Clostridia bacterium]